MGKIDELPLDIFDETGSTPGAAAITPAPTAGPEAPVVPWAAPEVVAPRKLYDIVGVIALVAVLGLALRIIGAGFTTPVSNTIMAIIIYIRLVKHRKTEYYDRADLLLSRFETDIAAAKGQEIPHQVAAYRVAFDVGIVIVVSIGFRLLLWMTGFDRLFPGGILVTASLAFSIAAYVASFRHIDRTALHVWVHGYISRVKRKS